MSEAGVHFDLYRHLENAIDRKSKRGSFTFSAVVPEYGEDIRGFADLVLLDTADDPVLVIEAKRPETDGPRKDVDPYSPSVIRQAFDYAAELGAPYFATYNGERLVVFRTFEEGRQLLQRSTKSYEISSTEKFADTLLDEIARLEAGEEQWDSLDDAFVQRIRSLHELITPELEEALAERLDEDETFYASFVTWSNTQGFEYDDAASEDRKMVRGNFAEQAAYLIVNKIVFYKILENSNAYEEDVRPLAVSIHRVQDDLEEHFEEVVKKIDFEAVFEHDQIYSEIPLDRIGDRIREFILELEQQNLTRFDSDVIGRIYEGVIPAKQRHSLGEYYTPPAICDLITRYTIRNAHDRVLDPACGSGGFLVSAYNRKRELFAEEAGTHDTILSELFGVDINRFPAHLTAINLAIQDLNSYTERVNVEVNDFFHVEPNTQRFGRERASSSGEEVEAGVVEALGELDAVVGNPPYIRQENIEDKDAVRAHLSQVDGEHLSRRSDIYAYFVTHATQFLEEGGRLGFITSDRWLDTGYGADLQKFILDHFRVKAVIKFSRETFEDALVGSCVIFLEKEPDEAARDEHVAKFIRVNESIDIEEIVSTVEEDSEPNQMVRTENYRLVTRNQYALREEEKWSVFFNAPPLYFDLIANDAFSELEELAGVTYGEKTGANDFFYGRMSEWEELGIEEYTEPLLKASGQVNRILFNEEDAKEWGYLAIHDLVIEALEEQDEYTDTDVSQLVKSWLIENGHSKLAEYIEWGEDQGYHERKTTQARKIWFDLGEAETSDIVMTDFTWREHRVVWNAVGALGSTQFYYILPKVALDPKILCGILNSRVVWLMCELKGRWAEGAGMARSRLKVYETKALPIPDPRAMTDEERERIRDALESLMEREVELGDEASVEATEEERDALDLAVLEPLEMADRLDEVKAGVQLMVALREQAAGEQTDVLIRRPTEEEVIELEGVAAARESTTLGDFE